MKSVLLRSTLAAALLSSSIAVAYDDTNDEYKTSKSSFRWLMQDPMIRDYFTNLQQDLIPTRFDAELRKFYNNDPFLGDVYRTNIANEDKSLDDFTKHAQTRMLRLRKLMGSQLARQLHKMVVELARGMGFPDEAINDVQLYIADGEKNAFTVSASKNRIVVVFQSALLNSLTLSEVRAVVGHELGHIALGHTTLGKMNSTLINVLQQIFINPQELNSSGLRAMQAQIKSHACGLGCALKKHGVSALDNMTDYEPDTSGKLKLSPASLAQFLDVGLSAMREYLASDRAIDIVSSYRDSLVKAANGSTYIPKSNAVDFGYAMSAMMNAISRSQETSSDRISDSAVRRDYLSSAFIKLLGLDKFDIQDRKDLIRHVVQQGEDVLNTQTREELTENIGTSHPASVLRIFLIDQLPRLTSVTMANPFTKLVALNQYMLMERALAEFAANQPASSEAGIQQQKMFKDGLEALTKAVSKSTTSIVNLIKHRDLGQKHPRLSNLIHYYLAQRELQLLKLQELKQKIAETPETKENEMDLMLLNSRAGILENVFIPQTQAFLTEILNAVSEGYKSQGYNVLAVARTSALKIAASSVDIEKIRSTRQMLSFADPDKRWPQDLVADRNTPDFIVPREIKKVEETTPAQPRRQTISFQRGFDCAGLLVSK